MDFAEVEREFDFNTAVVSFTCAGKGGRARFKAIGRFRSKLVVVVFSPLGSEAISLISFRPANRQEGGSMKRIKFDLPPLSDEEEARIQAGIARAPDNPELTADEISAMRPAREVLPPELFAALTKGKATATDSEEPSLVPSDAIATGAPEHG